ncbi:hypothetical protein MKEN_00408700 [Mycena kentingensis (nom. inval.)]|nr:hypothetical protein MKEN_00408700 [Mycena kentingensis (nom. inval.)]
MMTRLREDPAFSLASMDPALYHEKYLCRSPSDSDHEGFCFGQAEEMERNYRREQRKLSAHPYNSSPRPTATRTRQKIEDLYTGGALDSQISSQEYSKSLLFRSPNFLLHLPPLLHQRLRRSTRRSLHLRHRVRGSSLGATWINHFKGSRSITSEPIHRLSLPCSTPTRASGPSARTSLDGTDGIAALRLENASLRREMDERAAEYWTRIEQLTDEVADCRARLRKWSELADAARVVLGGARTSVDALLGRLDDTEANV